LGYNIYVHKKSQGNSLCSYLKQTKMSLFFTFTECENRRAEEVLFGRLLAVGGWKKRRNGVGRWI
jgi:hypothetical protein